jgi:hypothetical protein
MSIVYGFAKVFGNAKIKGGIVGFPENRIFKIRIQQAARRGRKSERITNFKPEYNEENKIYRITDRQGVKAA